MADLRAAPPGWYCFKALPKKEHIAADLLRRELGLPVLCPRIAYPKHTRRGKVRFIEPLFPGYLFVQADLTAHYRRIRAVHGIRDIVAFGERVPLVPDGFIAELRARLDAEQLKAIPEPALAPGQEVRITAGPFRDWKAIVTGALDARQRVALLLDFLGRQMEVRLPADAVLPESGPPRAKVWEG